MRLMKYLRFGVIWALNTIKPWQAMNQGNNYIFQCIIFINNGAR